jgi:hypothetical protein
MGSREYSQAAHDADAPGIMDPARLGRRYVRDAGLPRMPFCHKRRPRGSEVLLLYGSVPLEPVEENNPCLFQRPRRAEAQSVPAPLNVRMHECPESRPQGSRANVYWVGTLREYMGSRGRQAEWGHA